MNASRRKNVVRITTALVAVVLTIGGTLYALDATRRATPSQTPSALAGDHAVNIDQTGLAIDGYDPVTYFTTGKPMKGDFQITAEHDGATYRFVSEQNRDRFRQNPSRYAPQYGGYCAYGVSVGKKFSSDPTVWKIVDGRLFLNLDQNIANLFNKDVPGHIAKADRNWKKIADEPAR